MVKKQELNRGFFMTLQMMVALVALVFLCAGQKAYSETIRPHVSKVVGWETFDAGFLTGDSADTRQIIWRNIGKNYEGPPGGIVVVRVDGDGNALIWADDTGVHFYDVSKNVITTPIDLTDFHFKNGPNVDYLFESDPTLSYFYVQWGKVKTIDKHDGKKHVVSGVAGFVLLDIHGNVLWKKTEALPSQDKTFIAGISISPTGEMLVGKASGDVDSLDDLDSWEVWDKTGEKIGQLPIVPHKISWSADGKKIKCEWYKDRQPGSAGKRELESSTYGPKGNFLSGDR